jgi:hypothetical protein
VSFAGTVSAAATVKVVVAPDHVGGAVRGTTKSPVSKVPGVPEPFTSRYSAIPELVATESGNRSVVVENPDVGLICSVTLLKVSESLAKLRPTTAVGLLEAFIVCDWLTSPVAEFTLIAA